jgi:hypothetical protein
VAQGASFQQHGFDNIMCIITMVRITLRYKWCEALSEINIESEDDDADDDDVELSSAPSSSSSA